MGQTLVLGLIAGGIYALFAVGIVLVHRGTGVLNFAQGEIGTAALLAAYVVVHDLHQPWVLGALVAVAVAALLGGGFEFLVVRRMISSDPVSTAVATVGLTLTLVSLEIIYVGDSGKVLDNPFDSGRSVAGVIVFPHQVLAIVVALALGFGLQRLLRRTDFGLGILAAAQDPAAVRLVGVPLSRVSLAVWGMGGALSGLAALLAEPTVGLITPGFASEFFVFGLAAAVIGGLGSLPGAVAGALALGVLEAAEQRYLPLEVPGERYLLLLAVVLVALLGRAVAPELRARLGSAPHVAEVSA
ncbi:MAG TPA: branched-chain amino acid ABC transporter permease [Mycobacteriales bacterium]|nr:branched-chain amino acid ABC transporter permease [Mycobacteriales bacterium]